MKSSKSSTTRHGKGKKHHSPFTWYSSTLAAPGGVAPIAGLPWTDGLPELAAASLAPRRPGQGASSLQSTYSY